MFKVLKRFLYRPTENLVFKDGKCLIVEADPFNTKMYSIIAGTIAAFSALSAHGLLFGPVSILGTAATALGFGGSLYSLKRLNNLSNDFVKKLYLLSDGKTIEIVGFGIINNVHKLKIEDFIDPETSESTKEKMEDSKSWIIETKQDDLFIFKHENLAYYPDVLKAVFKGENIDLSESCN